MNTKRLAVIAILILILFIGCSGNNANIRNLSESESKATQQELVDNWPDDHISFRPAVLVFDPNTCRDGKSKGQ